MWMATMWRSNADMYVTVTYNKVLFCILYSFKQPIGGWFWNSPRILHCAAYYIVIPSDKLLCFWLHVYVSIHIIYTLCYWLNTMGMTHLKIKKYNFTYCFNAPGVQPFPSKDKHTLELWCLKTGCWSFGWEVKRIWGKQNNDELRLYSSP
jgi:hypothetical protein